MEKCAHSASPFSPASHPSNLGCTTGPTFSSVYIPALLFDFTKRRVSCLFRKSHRFFLLDFREDRHIVRAALPRTNIPPFTLKYTNHSSSEQGMTFSALIRVTYDNAKYFIKLPEENCYDPAGKTGAFDDNEYISYSQSMFCLVFIAIELHAASAGVSEEGLETIRTALFEYSSITVKKETLLNWMHKQVLMTCYRREPAMKYGDFLIDSVKKGTLGLGVNRTHTKLYLEQFLCNGVENQTVLSEDSSMGATPLLLAQKGMVKRLFTVCPGLVSNIEKGEKIKVLMKEAGRLDEAHSRSSAECVIM